MSIQQNYGNIKPSLNLDFANTKQLDPRITYSRASTGTYYDGKTVAKAEENLLTQSGNVAVWSQPFSISRTANATVAPDGTTTAGLVTVDSSTGRHFVGSNRGGVAPIGSTITGSVFLKASTYGFASVQLSNDTVNVGTPRYAISVDLSNGTIGGFAANSGVSGQTASVVNTGNGWYRVILTMTTVGAGGGDGLNIIVTPMPTNGSTYTDGGAALPSFTGDGTSGIFVWGAQVELRSTATAYTPTTTAPITNYIPVLQTASAGTPRFDHNPITGESLGLLIEEQRTNLLTYSSDFDNAAWTKNNATVMANTVVAPDGTLTGDKLVENTANNTHYTSSTAVTFGAGTPLTASVYAKLDLGRNIEVRLTSNNGSFTYSFIVVSLVDGSTVTAAGNATSKVNTVTPVGNGWYRISVTATLASDVTVASIWCGLWSGASTSYTGNGYSGAYIWGAQLEAGAFATSYIPTVASQVTRAADSASMTGTNFSSWYNQGVGTLYTETANANPNPWSVPVALLSNSTANRTYIRQTSATSTSAVIDSAGVSAITISTNGFKGALAFQVGSVAFSANGASPTTSTLSSFSSQYLSLNIGQLEGSFYQNGTIKKLAYYPRRLTNTQIQALTT